MALRDAISDLRSILAIIPGGGTVDQKLEDFKNFIKQTAKEGAEEGAQEVIQPYIFGLGALAGGALLIALAAFKRTKRSSAGVSGSRRSCR